MEETPNVLVDNDTSAQPLVVQTDKSHLKTVILFVAIVVILASLVMLFLWSPNISQPQTGLSGEGSSIAITKTQPSTSITQTVKPTRRVSESVSTSWTLTKDTDGKPVTVLTFCGDECFSNYLLQWNDWLFYNRSTSIHGYNLTTGKSTVIYDISLHTSDFKGKAPTGVSDMQVINNTLYFSLGGYLRSGGIFWLDLPFTDNLLPHKLIDSANAKIIQWENRSWILGGSGDACWGMTNFSLVDLSTKTVSHIAKSTTGCIEGEEYVGIDKKNRMILAFHTPDREGGTVEKGTKGVYQYILAVPLANPEASEGIVAKQDMPQEITAVKYSKDMDKLYLLGNENYSYDLVTQVMTKVDTVPDEFPTTFPQWKDQKISEVIKGISLPAGYHFVYEEVKTQR